MDEEVTSPTFTLINEYRGETSRPVPSGRLEATGLQDLDDIGFTTI
jgi:tRNA A37 threonylcarbamoyladenosine biosynthesis protein TsaE